MQEAGSAVVQNAFREHRENWMADDLYGLFEGSRFQCVRGQTRLRRHGQTVTDIDAAIYDKLTGELALFQLKWQDFASCNVRTQRSKAENFIDQVDRWGKNTTMWIDQFGIDALVQSLKLKIPSGTQPISIRLVAVGRSNARFRSYGDQPLFPGLISSSVATVNPTTI